MSCRQLRKVRASQKRVAGELKRELSIEEAGNEREVYHMEVSINGGYPIAGWFVKAKLVYKSKSHCMEVS